MGHGNTPSIGQVITRDRLNLFMSHPNTEIKVRKLRADVAETVRTARFKKRLSQIEVAKIAGTSPSRVSELENELADPRLSTLARIAWALGLTVRVDSAA